MRRRCHFSLRLFSAAITLTLIILPLLFERHAATRRHIIYAASLMLCATMSYVTLRR